MSTPFTGLGTGLGARAAALVHGRALAEHAFPQLGHGRLAPVRGRAWTTVFVRRRRLHEVAAASRQECALRRQHLFLSAFFVLSLSPSSSWRELQFITKMFGLLEAFRHRTQYYNYNQEQMLSGIAVKSCLQATNCASSCLA